MTAFLAAQQIQRKLGFTGEDVDGDFGPRSIERFRLLGELARSNPDAQWPVAAVLATEWKVAKASSFADPADVAAFNKCKATGKTDKECFAVGDNGIGQFGANTAQTHTPMCALHASDMVARWGSILVAAHKIVSVMVNGVTITCSVEDRMSAPGRIDLNPAAAKSLKLKPPFLVSALWQWV